MMNAAHWTDSEKHPPKRARVDITDTSVQQKTLECDFVLMSSKNLFTILGLPDNFCTTDPTSLSRRDDFMAAEAFIKTLAVTNDRTQQSVALIQNTAKSRCFRCEDQLQYGLQAEWREVPDAEKSTLLKKLNCACHHLTNRYYRYCTGCTLYKSLSQQS